MVPSYFRLARNRLLLLLFVYTLCRVFFLVWNWSTYKAYPAALLLEAFLHGVRFDLSGILMFAIPLMPFWFAPAAWRERPGPRRAELALFAILGFVSIGLNFVDAEFVKFIGKRTSYDFLSIGGDLQRQSVSVLTTYWHFLASLIVLVLILTWIVARFDARDRRVHGADTRDQFGTRHFWAWRVAALLLVAIGIRGGFQFKPLHPLHAYFSTDPEIGVLTLNTPFNLIRTRPHGEIRRARYFKTDREAITHLREMLGPSRPPLGLAKNWNVVVLILESFSLEYMGASNDYPGYTPFLDELSKKAFFFPLNFANARRSIEGLPAVICGLPAMMSEPVLTSSFAANRLDCLPRLLSQHGYSSYFLHGAHNGSMHFDTFSNIAGFQHFVGLNEFPKTHKEDFDEYWGVLDEPMLQYAADTLDRAAKPAFLSVFTLSSHHPYFIPPQHRGKFPKGTLEIHESIGYTDLAIRRFFETAATRPWFKNTIFVITADHTQKSDQAKYEGLIGKWRVPMMIFVPGLAGSNLEASPERITQHADIMPSILDLLGIDRAEPLLVGQSVFDTGRPGRAYNATASRYWLIDPKHMVIMRPDGELTESFTHEGTYGLKPLPPDDISARGAWKDLRAVVHYMNEGLVGNSLYKWSKAL